MLLLLLLCVKQTQLIFLKKKEKRKNNKKEKKQNDRKVFVVGRLACEAGGSAGRKSARHLRGTTGVEEKGV